MRNDTTEKASYGNCSVTHDYLFRARMARRTEKPARKGICGCPFGSSDGNPDRETGEKGYLWSSFSELGRQTRQRNWRERIFVVVLFGVRKANQTEKPARKDICGRPFGSLDGTSNRETGKKGYLWSSFSDFRGPIQTEKTMSYDVCGCLFRALMY